MLNLQNNKKLFRSIAQIKLITNDDKMLVIQGSFFVVFAVKYCCYLHSSEKIN